MYLKKKELLEWIEREQNNLDWSPPLRLGFLQTKKKIQSGAFDADESEGTWKATAEVLGRENAQMNSELQHLRAALKEVYEELKTLHFMIDHDDDIFHERKKKYLSIIDYVGQSVAGSGAFDASEHPIIQAIRDFMPTGNQWEGYDALIAWLESTTPFVFGDGMEKGAEG